jgi:RNA polymerase sigma-70 factor, ECF subfamily
MGSAAKQFAEDLEAIRPNLLRYAHALARRNPDQVDDLMQETFAQALAKQHLFEPGTNLRAWLFTILHNLHVNWVRRAAKAPVVGSLDHPEVVGTIVSASVAEAKLRLRDVERALAKLPREQLEAILLIGRDGADYNTAARKFGVPVGTVRSRLSRGRAALREMIG